MGRPSSIAARQPQTAGLAANIPAMPAPRETTRSSGRRNGPRNRRHPPRCNPPPSSRYGRSCRQNIATERRSIRRRKVVRRARDRLNLPCREDVVVVVDERPFPSWNMQSCLLALAAGKRKVGVPSDGDRQKRITGVPRRDRKLDSVLRSLTSI
jgi:hypothetical protein